MSISTLTNRTLAEQAVTLLNQSNSTAKPGTTATPAMLKSSAGASDRGPAAIVDISALTAIFESKGKIPTSTIVSAAGQFAAYPPPGGTVEVETRIDLAGKTIEEWGPS